VIKKIHHVGIVVRSADEAMKFYRDALGLRATTDRVIEDQGVRGVLLAIGGSEIELLEPTRNDTGVAKYLESRGEGMHHICFESDDVDAELEGARQRGIQLIDEKSRLGLAGMIGFVHPKANHGVLVEFATPLAESHGAITTDGQYIDHIVVSSNDSAATAKLFSGNFGIEIKRAMVRPGTGAHLEFAKLNEVILEFAGPGTVLPSDEIKAKLGGVVLAVPDIEATVASIRAAGFSIGEHHPAVQPGALFTGMKGGTNGVPFGFIQYNALPVQATTA
jgi:methylmalonyl-CoA epimerase